MRKKLSDLNKCCFVLKWIFDKFLLFLDFLCCFLEMHLVKIVSFSIMSLCCYMVNALHMIVVVMLLVCVMFGISALRFSFSFIGPYLSIIFLSKMAYQTRFVPRLELIVNCSKENISFHSNIAITVLDPIWWGYEILPENYSLIGFYKSYILVFMVMTLNTVIRTRQKISRIDAGESPDIPHVLFSKTTRKQADLSLKEGLKYLINYGFYKFGIEITLSFTVILIAFRKDVFSVLYAVWVLILFLPKRTTLAILWPFFLTTLLFSILWQYSMAVGFSENSCLEYPWAKRESLTIWMFLPSFKYKPDTRKTLFDFVLLFLVQRQQSVFELERRYGGRYLGGSNKEVYRIFDRRFVYNPTPNHTISFKSWIDVAKFIFMTCFFRFTLAFLFWNGASNVNVLSLGYLVAAFIFLWIGYDLCLWPIGKILKWWNILLGFTVTVILIKTLLEFAGCVYGEYFQNNFSWLVGLLCISCYSENSSNGQYCNFTWDVVCFICVIFQRRYFKSFYFLHEKDDVIGIFRLQETGAKLMDELQEHKLKKFQERERKTLRKIKKNMNRIKAWQKRMQGLNYNEPTDHATAIYMGDYFMFDDLIEVSSKIEDTSSSSDEFDESGRRKTSSTLSGSEMVYDDGDEGKYVDKKKKEEDKESENDEEKSKKNETSTEVGSSKALHSLPTDATDPTDEKKSQQSEQLQQLKGLKLLHSFLTNAIKFLTQFFKKYSKDYRYIQSIIKRERKKQKFRTRRQTLRAFSKNKYKWKGLKKGKNENRSAEEMLERDFDKKDDFDDYKEEKQTDSNHKLVVSFLSALCMFIMSKTELLCYIIIFLHTVLCPTLISLPLPIMVFLWGSLTSVRPTTTFWTVLIAYTEIIVVIKALFQNSIFPWNSMGKKSMTRPENPPMFLGIHRNGQYVTADLFLLLLLFLHRYKLKTLGLWNRTHEKETQPPQNLHVYKELNSEKELKDVKGNRSLVYQRKMLITDTPDSNTPITDFLRMAIWKCTSKATAKLIYRGNKVKTKILIKEIEGKILVTHEGRRLQPTNIHVSQMTEKELEGNVVLRVYNSDIIVDSKAMPYKLSWVQHFTPLRKFFVQILVRDWRVSADFYTLMFIFEFLDFLIVFFGYSSFVDPVEIQSEDYFNLMESQVPPMYLCTLIAHFLTIIIDRILYLRKNVVGKLILHLILVILIHVWMFIVIPIVTESSFNALLVPQVYYTISCLYFLMSAYQLRVGYPVRVQGHFLCKKYGYVNFYAYKGLQLIPFFNQLRILLDYLCTHSSLTIIEWIKLESIFQLVFENKCSRRADIHYPSARGKECPKCSKYCPGVLAFCGSIIVIWLPFIIFALFNTVAQANLPQEARIEVHIGSFGKIYSTSATFNDIITLTNEQYKTIQTIYKDNKKVRSFLSLYDNRDVGVLKFRFEPFNPWPVTPLELSLLNETVQNLETPVYLYVTWIVDRIPRSQIVATARGLYEVVLNKSHKARYELADAFLNKGNAVHLNNVLPKFVHVTNEGKAKPIVGFLSFQNRTNPFRSITISLRQKEPYLWWKLEEIFDDEAEKELNKIPYQSNKEITIYTFNQKNIPSFLLNVRKKGIIGLYLSIVIFTWTFIKRLMWKYPYIMYDDMPNPDPVLKLCHDIYLARASHEFALEEDLYAKLLFLFRSPETMIKVTRLTT